jgi:hypothetical protein
MVKITLSFLLGVLLTLTILFFVWPQYSDYRSRAETDSWLVSLTESVKKEELIKSIVDRDANAEIFADLKPKPDYIQITESSALVIKGGRDGQVVVLIPKGNGEMSCVAGSTKASPKRCSISGL